MSRPSDGGQRVPTAYAHLFRRRGCTQMRLPCENDQAKLDHISRLACSTNLSKILVGCPPERGPLGSRPRLLRQGVPELVALTDLAFNRIDRRFCANLLNLSNFPLPVKLNLLPPWGRSNSLLAGTSQLTDSRPARGAEAHPEVSHSAKISNIDQRAMRLSH